MEVAFALNVSYHIIPNIHELGKKKIDDIETKKIQEWESKIAELSEENEKTKYQTMINTIRSTSEEITDAETISRKISSMAPYAAIVSVLLLFFGSLGFSCLDSWSSLARDSFQTIVVVLLLLPNIVALGFQFSHWKEIQNRLTTVITALEKNK